MTVLMWLALVLQSCSVAMLRLGLGKAWLRRPGTLLVLASVVYDGLSQVLVAFPSIAQWDMYRNGIQPGFIAEADLIMSAGMLAFTVAYLMTWRPRRQAPAAAGDAGLVARVLDWRLLALACLPLAVLTYEGRGYNGAAMPGASSPSIADTFFVILVILTAFAFLLRHGERWFVPVLAAQSLLLAAAGERGMVITGAIALTVLLCWCGLRPRRSHLHAAVALTLLAVLAITGLRAEQGRSVFWSDSGLGTRAKALGDGLSAAPVRGTPGQAAQAAVRRSRRRSCRPRAAASRGSVRGTSRSRCCRRCRAQCGRPNSPMAPCTRCTLSWTASGCSRSTSCLVSRACTRGSCRGRG
jgi:hypothetical protein